MKMGRSEMVKIGCGGDMISSGWKQRVKMQWSENGIEFDGEDVVECDGETGVSW